MKDNTNISGKWDITMAYYEDMPSSLAVVGVDFIVCKSDFKYYMLRTLAG